MLMCANCRCTSCTTAAETLHRLAAELSSDGNRIEQIDIPHGLITVTMIEPGAAPYAMTLCADCLQQA